MGRERICSLPCLQGRVGEGSRGTQCRALPSPTSPLPNPTAIRHSLMAFATTRAMARKRRASPLQSQGRESHFWRSTAQLLP